MVSRTARQRFEQILPNAALVAASLTIGFAFLEGTIGIWMPSLDTSQDMISHASPEVRQRVLARRGHVVMPQEWKMLKVEVSGAHLAYYWQGALHVYDKDGMRFQSPIPAKNPDTFRIMIVGDSLTYGYGVDQRWAYPTVLERKLQKNYQVEVLNLGISGYQSEDIENLIQKYYASISPDIVVYGICLNDFLESGHGVFSKKIFKIPQYLRNRSDLMDILEYLSETAGRRLGLTKDFYDDIIEGMDQSRFARDLKLMNKFVIDKGGKPIVSMVLDPQPEYGGRGHRLAQIAEKAAHDAGMTVIPTEDYYKAFSGTSFAVSPWEVHPNEFAHELYAAMFYERLKGCCGIEHFRLDGPAAETHLEGDPAHEALRSGQSSH
jgi:lysophospholipase L1-like esterase